ncbi:MAG: hypothetical protein ABJO09_21550 [Hyphomicrobiales bacterium]
MGKAGAARVKAGDAAYAAAMQDHEDRLDMAGTRRRVREVPPWVYSPYASMDAPDPFTETAKSRETDKRTRLNNIKSIIELKPDMRNFSIMDACTAHVAGAKKSKAASKELLHAFMQFPTDLRITPTVQRNMLAVAVDFINETYGGNAVFHARIDLDEVGQHGVDVFFAPRYEKHTKSKGTEQWISLSKFSKENARARYGQRQKTVKNKKTGDFDPVFDKNGDPILIWNDADIFQGRALQDAWFEHLKENVGKDFKVERGKRKKGRDPDRLSPEDYALQQEREKLRAELTRQIDPTSQQEAPKSPYQGQVAHMIADARKEAVRASQGAGEAILERAREQAALIVWEARKSAEADVKAITYSMLKDGGKEFFAVKEENRMLHETVSRQAAIIDVLQDTLKRLLSDDLLKRIKSAFDAVWNKHSQNTGKQEPPEQVRYDGPSGP